MKDKVKMPKPTTIRIEKMPRAPRAMSIPPTKVGKRGKPSPVSPLKKKEFEY